ncbi:hypothetical protein SDRG_03747 [Saprolegnia diclina VS20]|uniref:MYND-type domain-containing protein n=1 Tax=Saprolegnia diclina (strain VS20) TaxID=1156394 RepID=T0S1B8_SAPDV|nr:hypothetical protein SDRG_03747 [Saprolegnia diclina VS20]EQC38788.1 hypothetical protein SDRG_03747 [Saprolegnia diclina VS20]|eukprot:XP_008607612.1 hypothetical protein SDRG_03747 [Saprolegnia diclina VS20]
MWERAPVAGRGFGALATVPIPAGTLVLRTTATASLPLDLGATCAHCFAPAALRCARCKLLKYCSRNCQRADWSSHGPECKYLAPYMASAAGPSPTPTVLLAARLHYSAIDPSDYATNLDAHAPDAIQRYRDMSALVLQILGATNVADTLPSMHRLLLTFAMLNCNAFTVCSPEQVPLGIGFYPLAAAYNHACVPNCVATFCGRDLYLRALRPISRGDELTIAYTELVAPTSVRRLELATSYFFHCDCVRCVVVQGSGSCWAKKEHLLEGCGCSRRGCAGCLEPDVDGATSSCPICLTVIEHDNVTPRLVQRAIQAADSAEQRKAIPEAIACRQRAYALTQASYHKYHADNIAGAETLANLIMSAENAAFRDAAQTSLALTLYATALDGLTWLYGPELAPLRGLTTLKYAQALHLANPNAKDEALRLVQEACSLLATTHGDDSSVVATAIALLYDLQRVES